MQTTAVKPTELKALEGMVLTNGQTYSSVGGSVHLGINDSADNWYAITEEEYNAIQEDMLAEMEVE